MESAGNQARGRVAVAIAAAIMLTGIIIVVAVASGGGDDDEAVAAPPPRCITAWNSDPAALSYGRHNFNFHLYKGALVTFLSERGDQVAEDDGGLCAVIFPSQALDPEPFAAGQVLKGKLWLPLSELEGIQLSRLAELQVTAAGSPNTTLDELGELAPL